MIVTRDTGIIVVCGELIRSDFDVDKDSSMQATYYIKTSSANWTDPTGAPGAKDISWVISAWDVAARLANPNLPWKETRRPILRLANLFQKIPRKEQHLVPVGAI